MWQVGTLCAMIDNEHSDKTQRSGKIHHFLVPVYQDGRQHEVVDEKYHKIGCIDFPDVENLVPVEINSRIVASGILGEDRSKEHDKT